MYDVYDVQRKSYSSRKKNLSDQGRKMPEILSVRLNDAEHPKRDADFEHALKVGGATATNVVRELIDAYNAFVEKHKRLPSFPLELIERKAPKSQK